MSSPSSVDLVEVRPSDDGDGFYRSSVGWKSTTSVNSQAKLKKTNTFVQLVLGDDDSDGESEGRRRKQKKHKGYSRTILLSALYAIVVTFVGLCFPIAEALKEEWQTQHWVAAFLVYLYVLSTAFLLYVQIYHVSGGKKHEKKEQEKAEEVLEKETRTSRTSSSAMPSKGDVFVVRRPASRIASSTSNLETLGEANEGFFLGGDEPPASPTSSGPRPPFKRQLSNHRDGFGFASAPPPYLPNVDSMSALDGETSDAAYEYFVMRSGTATLNEHGGASFYLRLGTLLFAIANLIYTGLQIEHFQGADGICRPYEIMYPYYFQMLFVLIQTFFIFKNTTVVIRKHKGFVRFGVMHVLATNMCNWLRVLVFEIMEAIHEQQHPHAQTIEGASTPGSLQREWDVYAPGGSGNDSCDGDSIMKAAAPYLFPFILEYSLIALAVMAGIYAGLNIQVTKNVLRDVKKAIRSGLGKSHDKEHGGHHEEPTFTKSHLGMFLGIVLLTGIIVNIILFYYLHNKPEVENKRRADLIFQISDLSVMVIMIGVTIPAMYKLYPMGFDLNRDNTIDHVLLLISLAGLFITDLFTIVAGFSKIVTEPDYPTRQLTVLNVAVSFATLIQGLLQSIFIIDGLQRFAETDEQVRKKPGRGLITFLTVANVSCWIYKILQEKKLLVQDELEFLGSPAWPIVQNIGLPLLLFFRFHSSICLAEMWHSAYEKEEHKGLYEEELLE